MGCCSGDSLFGAEEGGYIKINNGSFVAIEGSNTVAKLDVSSFRMPYKFISIGRITLKPSESNYLISNFGLGDNSNFIAIKATYKSKFEEDNYLNWSFYGDSSVHTMNNLMVFTSNSTNRTPQIYVSNPNPNHPVSLEVMVSAYDDNSTFYTDTITTYRSLIYNDITSIDGVLSIGTYRSIDVISIESVFINNGKINIKLDGETLELEFNLISDMQQAYSSLIFLTKNPSSVLPLPFDTVGPSVSFLSIVTSNEFDLTLGSDVITKNFIVSQIIDTITDLRDGILPISPISIRIYTIDSTDPLNIITTYYDEVSSIGIYNVELAKADNAGNVTIETLIMNVL